MQFFFLPEILRINSNKIIFQDYADQNNKNKKKSILLNIFSWL